MGYVLVELDPDQLALLEGGGYIARAITVRPLENSRLVEQRVPAMDLQPANDEALEVLSSRDAIQRLEHDGGD